MARKIVRFYLISSLCLIIILIIWVMFSSSEWNTIRTIGKEMDIKGLSYEDIDYKYKPDDYGPHGEADDYWVLDIDDSRKDIIEESLGSNPYVETITMTNRVHHQLELLLESFQSEDVSKEADMLSIRRGYILGYNITAEEIMRFEKMVEVIFGEYERQTLQIADWRITIYDIESKRLYIWEKHM